MNSFCKWTNRLLFCSAILTAGAARPASAAPATATVTTAVTASYALPSGTMEISQSNPASVVVGKSSGVQISPASAGQTTLDFSVQIQNTGASADQFDISLRVPDGWSAALVPASSGQSQSPSASASLTSPLALNAGQSLRCVLHVTCPAGSGSGSVTLRAASRADASQAASFLGTVQTQTPPNPAAGALALAWRVPTGGPVLGEATLKDGIAYIGSDDGCLYAIAATSEAGAAPGTVLWSCATGGRVRCAPAVYDAPNGRRQVSVGNDAGRLTTWDAATGEALWAAATGPQHGVSWRARPLVSADGALVTVPGLGASLCSFDTSSGQPRRRAPWRDITLAGNPAVLDNGNGAWLMGASGWGTWVRNGLPGRRVWLGGPASGSWAIDAAQNHLVGVTNAGHVAILDATTLLPAAPGIAGGGADLGVPVAASPVLDTSSSLLYVAAADHAIYAVPTSSAAPMSVPSRWFAPDGRLAPTVAAFVAAPLLWPTASGGAPTLYVGGTDGGFYAVPTDQPGAALTFTPSDGPLGEWDAAPAASGTGTQDVVVAGNSNGSVYGFRLR